MNKEQKIYWAAALQLLATGEFAFFGVPYLEMLLKSQGLPDSLLGVAAHGVIFVVLLVLGNFVLSTAKDKDQ